MDRLEDRDVGDAYREARAGPVPGETPGEALQPARPPRRGWTFPVAMAAAFAAGGAALGLAFWAADLSRELDDARVALHLSEEASMVLADPDVRRLPLEGARGVLVVDDATGEGWLVVLGLEPAPEGRTYEAWVIRDGEAVPAGLFAGGGRSTVVSLAAPVPDDAVVAVTIEEAGGVRQPTQDPVVVARQAG